MNRYVKYLRGSCDNLIKKGVLICWWTTIIKNQAQIMHKIGHINMKYFKMIKKEQQMRERISITYAVFFAKRIIIINFDFLGVLHWH